MAWDHTCAACKTSAAYGSSSFARQNLMCFWHLWRGVRCPCGACGLVRRGKLHMTGHLLTVPETDTTPAPNLGPKHSWLGHHVEPMPSDICDQKVTCKTRA